MVVLEAGRHTQNKRTGTIFWEAWVLKPIFTLAAALFRDLGISSSQSVAHVAQ